MTLSADILLEQVRKVIKYLFEGEREKLLLRRKKYLEKKNLLGKRRAETFRKTNEALMKFINSKDSSEFGKYFYKQDGDVILFCYIRFKEFEEELIGTPKDITLIEFGSDILQYIKKYFFMDSLATKQKCSILWNQIKIHMPLVITNSDFNNLWWLKEKKLKIN